jgi:hypothetical protein
MRKRRITPENNLKILPMQKSNAILDLDDNLVPDNCQREKAQDLSDSGRFDPIIGNHD